MKSYLLMSGALVLAFGCVPLQAHADSIQQECEINYRNSSDNTYVILNYHPVEVPANNQIAPHGEWTLYVTFVQEDPDDLDPYLIEETYNLYLLADDGSYSDLGEIDLDELENDCSQPYGEVGIYRPGQALMTVISELTTFQRVPE
ncbi:MAG: hypothetical protein CMF74_02310 [Maricaulis sp.]|jgi:hypothetical protein|nr:hypothetical protein [Maricaulis sp.]|tara:strand:+ start:427 stop:864 length:438 start_codon:yes stop_codon:yes gene_type:complete